MNIGLNKTDFELVNYLRNKKPPHIVNQTQREEIPIQEYLERFYPKEQRNAIKKLDVSRRNLRGELDLSDFVNLEELDCFDNKLTSLNLNNCTKLKEVYCSNNQLTNLILPKDCNDLKELDLSNNSFYQDLSFLQEAVNLEKFWLENNKFYGSLEYLKKMKNLKELTIQETGINEGLRHLPDNLKTFYCSLGMVKEAKRQYQQNLTNQKNSLQDLQNQRSNLESILKVTKTEALALQKNIQQLQAKLTQAEENCQQLASKLDEEKNNLTEKELIQAKIKVEELEKELERAEEQLENQENKIIDLQKELINKKEEIKQIELEKQKEINHLKTEKNKLQLEFADLQTKLQENKSSSKEKRRELKNTEKKIKEQLYKEKSIELTKILRKREERLKKEIEKLAKKDTELQEKLTNKEQQLISLNKEIKNVTQVEPILEEHSIGEGGYGKVYRGRHESREVAVKKLLLINKDKRKEIEEEINILEKLRDRNIIQYYGVYYKDKEIWLIMDYAENGTLTDFIDNIKEYDWKLNANIIKQITSGLAYIHHKNIIHRDLKSLNVLMTAGNQAKIADFGLSRIKNASSSQPNSIKGSLR
jgi:hypothetical protein